MLRENEQYKTKITFDCKIIILTFFLIEDSSTQLNQTVLSKAEIIAKIVDDYIMIKVAFSSQVAYGRVKKIAQAPNHETSFVMHSSVRSFSLIQYGNLKPSIGKLLDWVNTNRSQDKG